MHSLSVHDTTVYSVRIELLHVQESDELLDVNACFCCLIILIFVVVFTLLSLILEFQIRKMGCSSDLVCFYFASELTIM